MLTVAAKNTMLNALGGVVAFASLHTGDPGSNGANELTGGAPAYARKAVTWNAAASANLDSSNQPTFDIPAGSTLTHFGLWSAATGGTFYGGGHLQDANGDPITETFGGQGAYTLADLDVDLTDPLS